jgi:hypothetical protein
MIQKNIKKIRWSSSNSNCYTNLLALTFYGLTLLVAHSPSAQALGAVNKPPPNLLTPWSRVLLQKLTSFRS